MIVLISSIYDCSSSSGENNSAGDLLFLVQREQTVTATNKEKQSSTTPNATPASNYFTLAISNQTTSSEAWIMYSDSTCTTQIYSFGTVASSSITAYIKFYNSSTYYFKIGDFCQKNSYTFNIGSNYQCLSETSSWGCSTVAASSTSIQEQ